MIASISCPLCVTVRRRSTGVVRETRAVPGCQLCNGNREILWSRVQPISDQMQRVADAMQAGDEERAAAEGRLAATLAIGLLKRGPWRVAPATLTAAMIPPQAAHAWQRAL